jgi:hypothetical protein
LGVEGTAEWVLHGALGGEALREALGVGAVVVDHVLALLPGEVELLVVPVPGRGRDAGVGLEAAVGGGVGPVGLDAAALRGPVVGVPQAGVEAHGLAPGERDPVALQVAEVADGHVVHHEAACVSSVILVGQWTEHSRTLRSK